MTDLRIGALRIGPQHPAALVAELSNNHNGSLPRALRLMDAAQLAGADAIKIQAYSANDLVELRGNGPAPSPWNHLTMRELYTKAATPLAWLPRLFRHAESQGIPIFSSVFGADGFRALEAVGNPVYKLAALDFGKDDLRTMVEATGKPIIRSCHDDRAPMGTALMVYCPKGYPPPTITLTNIARGYQGFSYHGTDYRVPARSTHYGAQFVEVHVQLAAEPSELEANVSLTESQFRQMVTYVRQSETTYP